MSIIILMKLQTLNIKDKSNFLQLKKKLKFNHSYKFLFKPKPNFKKVLIVK